MIRTDPGTKILPFQEQQIHFRQRVYGLNTLCFAHLRVSINYIFGKYYQKTKQKQKND